MNRSAVHYTLLVIYFAIVLRTSSQPTFYKNTVQTKHTKKSMRLRLLEDRSKTMKWIAFLFVASVVLGFVGVFSNFADVADFAKTVVGIGKPTTVHVQVAAGIHGDQILNLPEILLREGVYQNDSFVNEQGIVPAFWGGRNVNESQADEFKHFDTRPTYGPCYTYDHTIDWKAEIDRFNKTKEPLYNEQAILRTDKDDLQGYCRPGFIIIGTHYAHTRVFLKLCSSL